MPFDDEALSSWLARVAANYGLTWQQLVADCLGPDVRLKDHIDVKPPEALLAALSARTGMTTARLRGLTLSRFVPDVVARLTRSPNLSYLHSCAILLGPNARRSDRPRRFRTWISEARLHDHFACPMCFDRDAVPYVRQAWRLCLLHTCPKHGVLLTKLKPGIGFRADGIPATAAPTGLRDLDCITESALALGYADMPGGLVPVDMWASLLRTIADELMTHPSKRRNVITRRRQTAIAKVWKATGRPPPQNLFQSAMVYEELEPSQQVRVMEAAGNAVKMLTDNTIGGGGSGAWMFRPPPLDHCLMPWMTGAYPAAN